MWEYTEFQEKVAIAYAQTKFADYLSSASPEEKKLGSDTAVFLEYLETGLELSVIWNSSSERGKN